MIVLSFILPLLRHIADITKDGFLVLGHHGIRFGLNIEVGLPVARGDGVGIAVGQVIRH